MQMRCIMYLVCTAAEDEDVQKKGLVVVVMNMGPKCTDGVFLLEPSYWKIPMLVATVFPLHLDAAHCCLEKQKQSVPAKTISQLFEQMWSAMMAPRIRVRLRLYTGTYTIILESRLVSGIRAY
jgi:hypothetical protein